MKLADLKKKHGAIVAEMDVAAPVDLEYLFRDGVTEKPSTTGKNVELTQDAGLYVDGNVDVATLTLTGHALFATGNVKVKKLVLAGNMVVLGTLSTTEVHGRGDPFTLTVMGKVNVGLAVMERQFIMQFLGGGKVDRVVDTEGGADELVELWRNVKVKTTSDAL